jgi:hypothetical protein
MVEGVRKDRRRKLPVILAAALIILLPLVTIFVVVHDPTVAIPDGSRYMLEYPLIDDDLSTYSSDIAITHTGMGFHHRTGHGLECRLSGHRDAVILHLSEPIDTISISLGLEDFVRHKNDQGKIIFQLNDNNLRVTVSFIIGLYSTNLEYVVDDGSEPEVRYADLLLDCPSEVDLLVSIIDGRITSGINGIEDGQSFPSITDFSSDRTRLELSPGTDMYDWRTLTLFNLQAMNDGNYNYLDALHKTIVPNGMDFAFSLHLHADRAFLQQFYLMANLSMEYGLQGTYDCWVKGNPDQYGMDSPEYVEALHELQDSGWDIGIHAAEPRSVNRTGIINAIDTISSEYGEIRTWSDHGQRPQDLAISGTDNNSQYYTKDLVQEIGCGWINDLDTSQSYLNDLNLVGLNYTADGYEGVPTFRVSKQQAYSLFLEPGRQDNAASWLRALSSNRAVILNHDYLAYFFYVESNGSLISALPSHDGIINTPWKELSPKYDFQNCTWSPIPDFVDMLEMFSDRSVWFAPVRDVYDRSCLVQNVELEEDGTHITIINKNSIRVDGFTIFTKGKPIYHLIGDVPFTAGKGNGDSWHFIFDLEPGEVIVLEKSSIGEGGPLPYQGVEKISSVGQRRIDDRPGLLHSVLRQFF